MTKIAFSLWNKRIAPVFEVARHFYVTEEIAQCERAEEHSFTSDNSLERIDLLHALGVTQLVCGAITTETRALLINQGIMVCSFAAGDYEQVCKALRDGVINRKRHRMPGCGKQHQARQRKSNICKRGD